MRQFFKIFGASFLALVVFTIIAVVILFAFIGGLSQPDKVSIAPKSVLVVDLSQKMAERTVENPASLFNADADAFTGLYDVVRLIRKAKTDPNIGGIYVKCDGNANGVATMEEVRNALIDFKASKKFVVGYGDIISQGAYYVANVADKLYCNPKGGVRWQGFSMGMAYMKGLFQKLEIQPQVFYAGKYKSATEPLREEKMTAANRQQINIWLGELYNRFLQKAAEARKLDTALLRSYAVTNAVKTASDAHRLGLVDGAKYDDEVKDELKTLLSLKAGDKVNFVPVARYAKAVSFKRFSSKGKMAVLYVEGEIVYGKGEEGQAGSDAIKDLLRKIRLDEQVKALVLRINSPGGSSLASDIMWREIELTRKVKPVVVSFGDVAASGGYYIATPGDSIFAQPNSITGSIGVFAVVMNLQGFMNKKLGVTFDGVKTAPYADMPAFTRPLNAAEQQFVQNEIDTIYMDFKTRVADGRKQSLDYVDSIAQGRVWTGRQALELGLVDRLGGIQDAVDCAARMAKLTDYRLVEYPAPASVWEKLFGSYKSNAVNQHIKEEIGMENYEFYRQVKHLKQIIGSVQMRIPYNFTILDK
jgi:protease IV